MFRRGPVAWCVLLVVAFFSVVSLSCSERKTVGDSSEELMRANDLIDKAQYSEAIYVLNNRLSRHPGELKTRVLLASAYTGRAGLTMASFTVFAREIDKWKQIDDLLPESEEKTWLEAVAKISLRLQISLRAFDALPVFSSVQSSGDLAAALQTLDEGGRLRSGMAIFRALVRVVYFKNQLESRYRPVFLKECKITPDELTSWLTKISGEVEKIIEDVAYGLADPAAFDRTLKLSTDLKASVESILRMHDIGKAAATVKAGVNGKAVTNVAEVKLPPAIDLPPVLQKVYGKCGN